MTAHPFINRKEYASYKDSGVEWLGKIPEHWKQKPLFAVMKERQSKNYNNQVHNVLSLSYGKIIKRDVSTNYGLLPESFETYQIVDDGNIILRLTDLQNDKRSLRVGLVKERGIITSAYICLESKEKIDPSFAYYLLHSYDLWKVFYNFGNGVRQTMAFGDLKHLPLLLPPLPEQRAIVDFLDFETARIDALIAKYQRLVELLEEKRTLLISHVVTRGLDPFVPIQKTGVSWLKRIPGHWKVMQLKFVLAHSNSAIKPGPFGSQLLSSEMEKGDIKVYNQRNVINHDISIGENFITQEKYEELRTFEVYEGDILVTSRGTIGRCMVIPKSSPKGIIHPCLIRVRIDTRKILHDYFTYLIQDSSLIQDQLFFQSNATTIDVIYSENLKRALIALPPIGEQQKILDYLQQKTKDLDALISKTTKIIVNISDYKASLIFFAVTGRINVSN